MCAPGPGSLRPSLPGPWALGPGPRVLFAHSASGTRPGPPRGGTAVRGCVRSGAARPPPLRGPGPAHSALASLAGPGPRASPPAPPLGHLCGLLAGVRRPPRALAGPAALLWSPSLRCGRAWALARPSSVSGSRRALRVARRVPPGPPPSGLRGRRLPARGRGGCRRPFSPAPGPFLCSRAPAPAALSVPWGCCFACAALIAWGSPLPPPRPCRPRWGLAGSARLAGQGVRPQNGLHFSQPISAPPGLKIGPRPHFLAALTIRKLSTAPLHEM